MHPSNSSGSIFAILGSTNSGKTLYAIEQMLLHRSGVIGLPLRLLAREVYDKVVKRCGPSVVALVTGEERIVPKRTTYWICTTEAMPMGIGTEFVAVDEIQLCGDLERGHVFTDRLLHARGTKKTVFLGSNTIRGTLKSLIPEAIVEERSRYSKLNHTGYKKISNLVPRTACVAFSLPEVYKIAEKIRQLRGGAAIVMGALSPRTRNAQVDLYENDEVDFIVATDAIGMGLNLGINHVAFSSISKFDGRTQRNLAPNELGQIAGRAGRYLHNGTFGATEECFEFPPEAVLSIESGRYKPQRVIQWRNSELKFLSPEILLNSLTIESDNPQLRLTRNSVDTLTLKRLIEDREFILKVQNHLQVAKLWEVCQTPDYRNIGLESHVKLVSKLYQFVGDGGTINEDWIHQRLERLSNSEGEIDVISSKLTAIRTWNYVVQKHDWVDNTKYWREKTRKIEDNLSDTLHQKLINQFIDIRFSVLLRTLKLKDQFVPSISENGEVVINDQKLGILKGFQFKRIMGSSPEEEKAYKKASKELLGPHFSKLVRKISEAPKGELEITEVGKVHWNGNPIGILEKSHDLYQPNIRVIADDIITQKDQDKIKSRVESFVKNSITENLSNLINLKNDESLKGNVKGIAYEFVNGLGILNRKKIAKEVESLDQEKRKILRGFGIRFGQYCVYENTSIKPEATKLRLILWALHNNLEFCPIPQPGRTSLKTIENLPEGYYPICGFYPVGSLAIRVDIFERLLNILREQDSRNGFEINQAMVSIIGTSNEVFAQLMKDLGYKVTTRILDPNEIITTNEIGKESPSDQEEKKQENSEGIVENEASEEWNKLEKAEQKSPKVDAQTQTKPETEEDIVLQDASQKEESASLDGVDRVDQKIIYSFKWVPKKPRRKFNEKPLKADQDHKKGSNRARRRVKSNEQFDKFVKEKSGVRNNFRKIKRKSVNRVELDPDHPFAALKELRKKL